MTFLQDQIEVSFVGKSQNFALWQYILYTPQWPSTEPVFEYRIKKSVKLFPLDEKQSRKPKSINEIDWCTSAT